MKQGKRYQVSLDTLKLYTDIFDLYEIPNDELKSRVNELFIKYTKTKDAKYRDEIFALTCKLGLKLVKYFYEVSPVVDGDDVYQTMMIGLVKAIETFDYSKGYAFSSYAVPIMLNEVRILHRTLKNETSNISLSEVFGEHYENPLTVEEIISEPFNFEDNIINQDMINRALSKIHISDIDYHVICLYYGMNGYPKMIQKDIATKFGVTPTCIHGHIIKVTDRLRRYFIR